MSIFRSLVLAVVASLAATVSAGPTEAPTAAEADAFIAQVNAELLQLLIEGSQAGNVVRITQ